MTVEVAALSPAALEVAIPDLARLRIEVFRDFPYLYDGDRAYEERYLATYRESPGAIVVGAREGTRLVGAATGTPLADHAEQFGAPFRDRGYRLEEVFYCGESVLLPAFRGQGIGHRFFDAREAHATRLGARYVAFCAVMRDAKDPRRPAGYRPLDGFWRKRGYAPMAGVVAHFAWKDLGDAQESEKPLQFWLRAL